VEACNLIHCLLPLGRSNFRVTRDQPQPGSFLNKREEPGNEVANGQARGTSLGWMLTEHSDNNEIIWTILKIQKIVQSYAII
jgi:hypothetical protein